MSRIATLLRNWNIHGLRKGLRQLNFNLWYYRKPPWDTGVSPPELIKFIEENPPGKAIDMGCGTGTNVITLAQHGWEAMGVDFVARAIAKAQRKAEKARVDVSFFVADVTKLDRVSNSFDLILDIGCLHGLQPAGRKDYLDNVERLIAVNGTFLLYAFFRDEADEKGPGIIEADIELLDERFNLVWREDGTERGMRRSAWCTFQPQQLKSLK
jgi:SAM-dependent methyltransferase